MGTVFTSRFLIPAFMFIVVAAPSHAAEPKQKSGTREKVLAALHAGKHGKVLAAIEEGLDPDTRDSTSYQGMPGPGGPTLLMLTACGRPCGVALSRSDQASLAASLIAKGASVNARTSSGETALGFAVSGPHDIEPEHVSKGGESVLPLVNLLVTSGAPVDNKDDIGQTPLLTSATQGYFRVVELLLSRGAKANLEAALAEARRQGHKRTASVLQQHITHRRGPLVR